MYHVYINACCKCGDTIHWKYNTSLQFSLLWACVKGLNNMCNQLHQPLCHSCACSACIMGMWNEWLSLECNYICARGYINLASAWYIAVLPSRVLQQCKCTGRGDWRNQKGFQLKFKVHYKRPKHLCSLSIAYNTDMLLTKSTLIRQMHKSTSVNKHFWKHLPGGQVRSSLTLIARESCAGSTWDRISPLVTACTVNTPA